MYTAAIMKTELEASKGTRKLDMRIDNIQLVNVFTREISNRVVPPNEFWSLFS